MSVSQKEFGIDARVAFLSDPRAYGEGPVETRETHMSWVFLTPRHAYKLKKPVRSEQIDLSKPAAREANCREELRLNRRLSPSVYLDVVALTRTSDGALALGGEGSAVDWLVEMRRLADKLTLERKIQSGRIERSDVVSVARALAEFYGSEPPAGLEPGEYLEHFSKEVARSRAVLADFPEIAEIHKAAGIAARLEAFLSKHAHRLESRAAAVVDGHGDLRPEHIYLEDPPVIIDCLDFDRRLRLVDPVDDFAFLSMECARLGATWIEEPLFKEAAARIPHWEGSPELVTFYKAVHAFTRARLAVLHIAAGDPRTPEKWPRQTRERLALAEAYVSALIPEDRLSAHPH